MSRTIATIIGVAGVTLVATNACGPASRVDQPDILERVRVLSQNERGINIEHNKSGFATAVGLAVKHCNGFRKLAFYTNISRQNGANRISSWVCEKLRR